MPFTFAHPLFALPAKLAVRRLSLTGLVLGSMSPDFEYFFALEPYATIGHTWRGFWLQALPLSIMLALLFHLLVKRQLAMHLPAWQGMDRRALGLAGRRSNWQGRFMPSSMNFFVALLIGFGSHLLVDAFTHQGGYFVVRNAWLHSAVAGYPVYKLLQYSLSLIGLAALGLLGIRALHRINPSPYVREALSRADKLRYWMIVTACMVATLMFKFLLSDSVNYLGMTIVSAISGVLLGIVAASLWSLLRQRSTKK